ncbi:hypothetical protein EDC04DRAFT_2725943 [Pisolithus marmoratus]|nr:hypothetical protein EDC04DRAFT_2725943 [Pisolithus marmoratus]
MPAYDIAGCLIMPSAYRRCLQGAIAEVHFTLSHWAIATTKHNVYGGQIVFICILVLPPPTSAAGKKRKLPLCLDTDDSRSPKCTRV